MEPRVHERPGGITLIMALAILNSAFSILSGILILLDREDHRLLHDSGLTVNTITGTGIGFIVIGTIGLFIALALGRGSRIARLLFGIWAVLVFAGGIYNLGALRGEQQIAGAVSAAVGLIVLYLLYGSEKDREYFLN